MAKSTQRSVRLRPDQEAAIERLVASDRELKRSSVIRRAIDEYLERRRYNPGTKEEPGRYLDMPKERPLLRGRTESKALVVTDPAGRVTYVDAEFTKMCGYTLAELKDKKPGDVLQGPDTDKRVVSKFRRAIKTQKPFVCDLTNYDAQRQPYRVHIEMEPVFDDKKRLIEFRALEERLD